MGIKTPLFSTLMQVSDNARIKFQKFLWHLDQKIQLRLVLKQYFVIIIKNYLLLRGKSTLEQL